MKFSKASTLALALALCACGGGDGSSPPPTGGGGSSSGGGTPTPTPSPVTYNKFADLMGQQAFASTCGGEEIFNGQTFTNGATGFGEGIAINSDRSGPSYDITVQQMGFNPPFSLSFTQADRDPAAPAGTERYKKTDASGNTQRFGVSVVTIAGVAQDYVRLATLSSPTGVGFVSIGCAFGVPTVLSDVPSATKSYSKAVATGILRLVENAGTLGMGPVHTYSTSPTTMTATANPANGQISFTLNLKGQEVVAGTVSDTVTDLGTYTGSTTIDGSKQSFSGIVSTSGGLVVGNFGGWFFGPQGATMAVSFKMTERRPDNSDVTYGGVTLLSP
ncbi:hypothetical protein [Qipengyuania sp. RANM35]|uniref:hypothetical protein n=1 Tax=Qipengyuania sp. RANM35 TaxID=3068635 RepID=UPI0034DB3D0A